MLCFSRVCCGARFRTRAGRGETRAGFQESTSNTDRVCSHYFNLNQFIFYFQFRTFFILNEYIVRFSTPLHIE